MPTYQTITVDITPGAKEKPVLNASQFDNGRPFNVALTWGGVPFTDAGDFDIEIHVKKPDGNIVTAEPDSVVNDVCSFLTTEQMCACHGINECEIVLFDNDIQIGTGNFILDVEKAPDEGGLQSASEIANLARQIDAITLTYLINNTDEIAEIIANKIYPTLEASGDIATFNTILQLPLVSVAADPSATIITRCGVNLWDEQTEFGLLNSDGSVDHSYTSRLVTKNFIPVVGGKTYAFVYNTAFGRGRACWYDANKNLIQYYSDFPTTQIIDNRYALETAPANACYFKYCFTTSYGPTYLNDTGINYPSSNTYHDPYNGTTKPIAEATTIKTLTGINNVFTDNGPVTVEYKYFPDI